MTKSELNAFKKQWAIASQSKNLLASHHVMYNILRGYSPERGFSPITNHNKLTNGAAINLGVDQAVRALKSLVYWARRDDEWAVKHVGEYIAHFNGAITPAQLAALELPDIIMIESNFGIGKKIAAKIVQDNLKDLTFDDITAMSVDLAA